MFCHQIGALGRQQGLPTAASAQRRTEQFLVQQLFLAWLREGKCTRREFCIVYEVAKRKRKPSHLVLERATMLLL